TLVDRGRNALVGFGPTFEPIQAASLQTGGHHRPLVEFPFHGGELIGHHHVGLEQGSDGETHHRGLQYHLVTSSGSHLTLPVRVLGGELVRHLLWDPVRPGEEELELEEVPQVEYIRPEAVDIGSCQGDLRQSSGYEVVDDRV